MKKDGMKRYCCIVMITLVLWTPSGVAFAAQGDEWVHAPVDLSSGAPTPSATFSPELDVDAPRHVQRKAKLSSLDGQEADLVVRSLPLSEGKQLLELEISTPEASLVGRWLEFVVDKTFELEQGTIVRSVAAPNKPSVLSYTLDWKGQQHRAVFEVTKDDLLVRDQSSLDDLRVALADSQIASFIEQNVPLLQAKYRNAGDPLNIVRALSMAAFVGNEDGYWLSSGSPVESVRISIDDPEESAAPTSSGFSDKIDLSDGDPWGVGSCTYQTRLNNWQACLDGAIDPACYQVCETCCYDRYVIMNYTVPICLIKKTALITLVCSWVTITSTVVYNSCRSDCDYAF